MLTMPLVGGADLHGTASGDPTDLRFNRPYKASSTGLIVGCDLYASCKFVLEFQTLPNDLKTRPF
eukprot:2160760-Pleurochrysis_carterae.AAC.5